MKRSEERKTVSLPVGRELTTSTLPVTAESDGRVSGKKSGTAGFFMDDKALSLCELLPVKWTVK